MVTAIAAKQFDEVDRQCSKTFAHSKESQIGQIPADWNLVPIGSLFAFKNGLNKGKRYFGYGTPIINYMDVFSRSGLKATDITGLVDVSKKEIENFSAKKGDVFFTRTSETLDEVGVASVLLEDIKDSVFSGFVLRGRPINDDLVDGFKKYCFVSTPVRQQIVSKGTYTTRALTNGRVLSSVLLPFPPTKTEQQAIADVLSDADAHIELLKQLIEKKRLIKEGAMQNLLSGRERLPGFTEDWKIVRVVEFGEVTTGSTPPTGTSKYWRGNYPWVTPTDISYRKNMFGSERYLTEVGVRKIGLVPRNTLLVTCIASIGKNAILRVPGGCNQQINAIVPNERFDVEFLYYLIDSKKNYLIANSGITATRIIPKRVFSALSFSVPELVEQKEIASILTDMDAELEMLEARLEKACRIKQGMMQELLTGRVRFV